LYDIVNNNLVEIFKYLSYTYYSNNRDGELIMRCNNCGKIVPDVSKTCSFCGNVIDITKKYVQTTEIETLDENPKFDLKKFVLSKENRKLVIGFVVLILFILIMLIVFLSSIFSKKTPNYKYFTNVLSELSEYLEDNYLSSTTTGSGEFTITSTVKDDKNTITGEYEYDIKNKILSINAEQQTSAQTNSDGIIIDGTKISFSGYLSEDDLYLYSKSIYNNYIYFLLPDKTGLLSTKKYDLDTLVVNNFDAAIYALKKESMTNEKKKINYFDKNVKVSCVTLTLDNDTKYSMIKNINEYLLEESNYINELAKINNKTTDDIINELNNNITTAEYKYSKESDEIDTISIYYKGSKVYRLEYILSNNTSYVLDVDDIKFKYQYKKDNTKYEVNIVRSSRELTDQVEVEYDINYDLGEKSGTLEINLLKNNKSNVKKQTIENSKDISTFTDSEYETIKNNLNKYISNTSIIDKIKDIYKEKCTPDLNCVCDLETCSCNYNDEVITCDIEKIKTSN